MKTWVVVWALQWLSLAGWGQTASTLQLRLQFRYGRVVLATGDTLDGPVALQFGPDLLYLVQADGSVRTFAPAAVAACAVRGEMPGSAPNNPGERVPAELNPVRLFRTLDLVSGRNQPRPEPGFFEQLSAGPVLLVRRPRCQLRQVNMTVAPATVGAGMFGVPVGNSRGLPPPAVPRYGTVTEVRDDFFLALPTGELRPLHKPKKDLLAVFSAESALVAAYMQAHRMGLGSVRELVDIVTYANSLPARP